MTHDITDLRDGGLRRGTPPTTDEMRWELHDLTKSASETAAAFFELKKAVAHLEAKFEDFARRADELGRKLR